MFSSFIGKNSTAEKAKLLLAFSDFYITFASVLTSFLFKERAAGWEEHLQPKKIYFFPSAFLLSLIYTSFYSASPVIFNRSGELSALQYTVTVLLKCSAFSAS